MYQIDNHENLAQQSIVPYLLSFNDIANISKYSGTRAQYLEDVLWNILYSNDVETANGTWLDYIGEKVGMPRAYFASPVDGFTFNGTSDQGFGAGKFLSSYGTGSSTKTLRSNADYRNAIKAKIIQNNTDCSVDELINACKLLFNASIVLVTESYPAGLDTINMYGSVLLETSNAYSLCKLMMPAGVSLGSVNFYNAYNIFKNDAFIYYNYPNLIPSTDDFTLSFSFVPDNIGLTPTALLSQSTSITTPHNSVTITYDDTDGIIFATTPSFYVDENGEYYVDENGEYYVDSLGQVTLSGGSINVGEINRIKIIRSGDDFYLYVDDVEVASNTVSGISIGSDSSSKLYLGNITDMFYNSGSIYNLLLVNDTTSSIIINDSLKIGTIGINNGVVFI